VAFDTPVTDPAATLESLPTSEPSVAPSAELNPGAQTSSLTPTLSLEELANDPTVVMQPIPSAELYTAAETSSPPPAVALDELASDPEDVVQIRPSFEPSVAPSVDLNSTAQASFSPPAMTLQELANDPTVVIQRLPSSETNFLPSVVSNAGEQKSLSYPAVRTAAAIGDRAETKTPFLRYALTVQELINDPTVVVQGIPGYAPILQGSLELDPASQTSSLNPVRSPEERTNEPTIAMQSGTGSALYAQNSFLPILGDFKLRISNGSDRDDLARSFAGYISERGFAPDFIANARSSDYKISYVFYNPGLLSAAEEIAEMIPVPVKLIEASRGFGNVEVVLGSDLIDFDVQL
jgi:hypothetical protein